MPPILERTRWPLAWRLYAVGLVQLLLLSGIFVGVGWLINGPLPDEPQLDRGHQGPPSPGAFGEPEHERTGDHDGPPLGEPPPRPRSSGPHRKNLVPPLATLFCGGLLILGVGSLLTARWIVGPLRDLSRVARALGAGDLRARSALIRSDELGDLARAFNDMATRVETLLLAEKELLANVSHELRTPIARIRVALDIAGEVESGAGRVSMSEIGLDLAELETLIDDILTTTRLEVGRGRSVAAQFQLHREEIGAGVLCERSAERFRSRHPTRPLQLSIGPSLPLVEADPVLFRRVFDNLLENADKYSPDPTSPIAARVFLAGATMIFEVEDRGMGIPADDLAHVFMPFFRGDRSRTRGTGGVGLGLTLAKRIVEAHGGTIQVKSRAGADAGTTVRIELALPAGLR